MTSAPWQSPGYSEIARVTEHDGEFVVEFANGDVVVLPPSLLRGEDPTSLRAVVDESDPLGLKLVSADETVRTIGWSQIRVATDPRFAQHMRESDAEESRRFGRRLKALREDRGMKQADLAALVDMTAPQLSKIEKGMHDMRVSTARALLRALDASFADISGSDAPDVSLRTITRRLAATGVNADVATALLARIPRRSTYRVLNNVFGLRPETVSSGTFAAAPLAGSVQFKTVAGSTPQTSPLLHLARSVAGAGRQASVFDWSGEVPSTPAQLRDEVLDQMGEFSLETLLVWLWRRGVPVLPMGGRGGFAAAVWNIGGPIIVIKDAREIPAYWLFDLAHELGHIARGHVLASSLIDVDDPTSGEALSSADQQESEANDFALNLLAPEYPALLAEVRDRSRGYYLAFKDAVASTAKAHGVNAGVLGLIAAHELIDIGAPKDRWGSANNLSKLDGSGREVAIDVAARFLRFDDLPEEERLLLEAAVLER